VVPEADEHFLRHILRLAPVAEVIHGKPEDPMLIPLDVSLEATLGGSAGKAHVAAGYLL
jgi:hypothetical protein